MKSIKDVIKTIEIPVRAMILSEAGYSDVAGFLIQLADGDSDFMQYYQEGFVNRLRSYGDVLSSPEFLGCSIPELHENYIDALQYAKYGKSEVVYEMMADLTTLEMYKLALSIVAIDPNRSLFTEKKNSFEKEKIAAIWQINKQNLLKAELIIYSECAPLTSKALLFSQIAALQKMFAKQTKFESIDELAFEVAFSHTETVPDIFKLRSPAGKRIIEARPADQLRRGRECLRIVEVVELTATSGNIH